MGRAGRRRTDLVAVAILNDLDANFIGSFLGVALIPGFGILHAGDANLRVVRRMYADVAVAVAYGDARIYGNGLGWNLQVEVQIVSPIPKVRRKCVPSHLYCHNDATHP